MRRRRPGRERLAADGNHAGAAKLRSTFWLRWNSADATCAFNRIVLVAQPPWCGACFLRYVLPSSVLCNAAAFFHDHYYLHLQGQGARP